MESNRVKTIKNTVLMLIPAGIKKVKCMFLILLIGGGQKYQFTPF